MLGENNMINKYQQMEYEDLDLSTTKVGGER